MIPKQIYSAVGDILDVIKQLAPSANRMIELYERYKHPLAFINYYMRSFPESSRAWGGILYRAAKFFATQGDYFAWYPDRTPIDRNLVGHIPVPATDPLKAYTYRYNLEINVNSPSQGFSQTFNFWVPSPYLLSRYEVLENAIEMVTKVMDKYRLTFQKGFPNSADLVASEIKQVMMYSPDANNG